MGRGPRSGCHTDLYTQGLCRSSAFHARAWEVASAWKSQEILETGWEAEACSEQEARLGQEGLEVADRSPARRSGPCCTEVVGSVQCT